MTRPPPRWADLSRADLAGLPADAVAVLPLGGSEQHGDHLPLGVETVLTNARLARAMTLLAQVLAECSRCTTFRVRP